ncbi:15136_t:CDS:2 [Entrophospora sp. SA101]|nr:15136_t:CDS:2 [Entrophospora sp. SA101]
MVVEVDTEEIDFTNEATIKFPESKETFEINYNEQNGTWSLEIVKSSYHVNTGEFDNFETSNSASSDDSSSNDSSSENGNDKDDSDSGESTLNPEFVELTSMMKTSLNQENRINNLNCTKIKINNKLNVAANHNSCPMSLEQFLGGGEKEENDDENGSSS